MNFSSRRDLQDKTSGAFVSSDATMPLFKSRRRVPTNFSNETRNYQMFMNDLHGEGIASCNENQAGIFFIWVNILLVVGDFVRPHG